MRSVGRLGVVTTALLGAWSSDVAYASGNGVLGDDSGATGLATTAIVAGVVSVGSFVMHVRARRRATGTPVSGAVPALAWAPDASPRFAESWPSAVAPGARAGGDAHPPAAAGRPRPTAATPPPPPPPRRIANPAPPAEDLGLHALDSVWSLTQIPPVAEPPRTTPRPAAEATPVQPVAPARTTPPPAPAPPAPAPRVDTPAPLNHNALDSVWSISFPAFEDPQAAQPYDEEVDPTGHDVPIPDEIRPRTAEGPTQDGRSRPSWRPADES